ncbi:hypothetical protein OHB12_19520 [Nocardia sp. NBC_01730]|uniref:hypothetical protein n=1 Tax=Nocardia sp. NBC_01730 TaxID=2975998 RepID=UPI002E0D8CD3|nr:hypothetical protein OHB12_19520 [Nocardia sp. NBC_01730]
MRASVPGWREVIAAFRGENGYRPGDHLIARWAKDLAHLHRVRHIDIARTGDIDRRRGELVTLIDNWVTSHVASSDAFGRAVDELAAAHVAAEILIHTRDAVPQNVMHDAWFTVGMLAVAWVDLVAEVVDGQPPVPWTLNPNAST